MTDRDIIERVCELWGTRLYTHIPKVKRYKPVFRTELVGGSAVAMMALLSPHMGERRRGRIAELIGPAVQTALLREARSYYGLRWAA